MGNLLKFGIKYLTFFSFRKGNRDYESYLEFNIVGTLYEKSYSTADIDFTKKIAERNE
jgi:hypothetical protein